MKKDAAGKDLAIANDEGAEHKMQGATEQRKKGKSQPQQQQQHGGAVEAATAKATPKAKAASLKRDTPDGGPETKEAGGTPTPKKTKTQLDVKLAQAAKSKNEYGTVLTNANEVTKAIRGGDAKWSWANNDEMMKDLNSLNEPSTVDDNDRVTKSISMNI